MMNAVKWIPYKTPMEHMEHIYPLPQQINILQISHHFSNVPYLQGLVLGTHHQLLQALDFIHQPSTSSNPISKALFESIRDLLDLFLAEDVLAPFNLSERRMVF